MTVEMVLWRVVYSSTAVIDIAGVDIDQALAEVHTLYDKRNLGEILSITKLPNTRIYNG